MRSSSLVVILAFLFFSASLSLGAPTFSYKPTSPVGPSRWGNLNLNCLGSAQSPIDISTADVCLLSLTFLFFFF